MIHGQAATWSAGGTAGRTQSRERGTSRIQVETGCRVISRRIGRIVELRRLSAAGRAADPLLQFCCNYCPCHPNAATIEATSKRGVTS